MHKITLSHAETLSRKGVTPIPRYLVERTFPDGIAIPMADEGAQTCQFIVLNNATDGVSWVRIFCF